MEKDIDRIPKNGETDIVIRVDDFGGRRGVTIREFVKSERYTGFTKAGTRIPAEHFAVFKKAINSIDEKELLEAPIQQQSLGNNESKPASSKSQPKKPKEDKIESIEEQEF
ncbi:hypothetical protein J4461_04470 [Candidatus Pacearchaeota archaeon]|nr:hypothetical protein [Candidatus Pacearchaeota archaeon]